MLTLPMKFCMMISIRKRLSWKTKPNNPICYYYMIDEKSINITNYSKEQKMYRYMEIEKLIFMITENALPLSRITLSNDPYEYSYPKKLLEREKQAFKQMVGNKKPIDYRKDKNGFMERSKRRELNWRRNFFASCWHANDYESEAMWRLYSNYQKGLAIQTDLITLINELPDKYNNKGFKYGIQIAEVKYIDFNNPEMSFFHPGFIEIYLLKRKAFNYENEIRIFTQLYPDWGIGPEIEDDYILLNVNLRNIIKKIIIAPNSPSWYKKLILSILEKYGYDLEVENSSLAEKPSHVFWADIGIIDDDEDLD